MGEEPVSVEVWVLGIVGQNPRVSKSDHLRVDICRFDYPKIPVFPSPTTYVLTSVRLITLKSQCFQVRPFTRWHLLVSLQELEVYCIDCLYKTICWSLLESWTSTSHFSNSTGPSVSTLFWSYMSVLLCMDIFVFDRVRAGVHYGPWSWTKALQGNWLDAKVVLGQLQFTLRKNVRDIMKVEVPKI